MAFNENTRQLVSATIESETKNAVENWGEHYNSLHEGYAVLKEEVEETRDEQINIKNSIYDLWSKIKVNNVPAAKKRR